MVIVPSPSSLRSATSPKGRGKGGLYDRAVVALSVLASLGHLSQRERQGGFTRLRCGCPLRPRFARPPLPKGEARDARSHDRAVVALSVLASLGHLSQRERQGLTRLRCNQPPFPTEEARGASHDRASLGHLSQRERRGGFTRLRFARPPLPKGEARGASHDRASLGHLSQRERQGASHGCASLGHLFQRQRQGRLI